MRGKKYIIKNVFLIMLFFICVEEGHSHSTSYFKNSNPHSHFIFPRKPNHRDTKYLKSLNQQEILVDTTRIILPAPFEQRECDITSFNNKWLCVWTDLREYYDPIKLEGEFRWSKIYGTFISSDGVVLTPTSFAISKGYGGAGYSSTVNGNSNLIVVWEDYRNGNWESPQIFGIIIDTLGQRIDTVDIHISSGLENKKNYFPTGAFDGSNYLIIWYAYDPYELYQIYGRRISQNGNFIDPYPVKISIFPPFPFILPSVSPSISFDGNYYLIVFEGSVFDDINIYGIRITPSMQIIDQTPITISEAYNWQFSPSSVYKNGYHFIVWSDQRNNLTNIYGARVTPSGELIDPEGILISSSSSWFPSVSSDLINYFVVWQDWREGNDPLIYGARVSNSGIVIDSNGIKFSNSNLRQMYAKIEYASDKYIAIWEDYRNSYLDIYGTRATPEGNILEPDGLIISSAANFHFNPKCSYDGNNYIIIWEDWRKENGNFSEIYGIRLDPYGNILHPLSFPISETGNWSKVFPSIATSEINHLVVWSDARNGSWDIYGVRIDFSGNRLDSFDIPISKNWSIEYYPSVAYGGNYFVVWEDTREGNLNSIYGARINKFGHILDTAGIKVSINTNTFKIFPCISYGNEKFLLAWTDIIEDYPNHYMYSILGTRLTQNGEIIDSNGIVIAEAGMDSFWFEDQFAFPSVASNGENYLITYNRFEYIGNYWTGFDIFFTIIDTSGNVLLKEIPVIAYDEYDQMYPVAVFDGENYLIVWQDERNGSFDIYGVHVTPNGEILEPGGFPIACSQFLRATPSLTKGPVNQILISYQGFIREGFNSYRTMCYIYNSVPIYEFSFKSLSKPCLFALPNPFKDSTIILFYNDFDEKKDLILSIFDLNGRIIKEFYLDKIYKGINKIVWNGRNKNGYSVPAGQYFCFLNTNKNKFVLKILKIK